MNRILLGLAGATYVLVVATMIMGLMSHPPEDYTVLGGDAFFYHFSFGIITALFTVLVHCIVFTYFLGTGRWVKETAGAYRLEEGFVRASRRLRAQAMAAAVTSILLVVATVASGAGVHTRILPLWVHQSVPLATYLFMAFAFWIEIRAVETHIELTDRVMVEVTRIRKEHGLEE